MTEALPPTRSWRRLPAKVIRRLAALRTGAPMARPGPPPPRQAICPKAAPGAFPGRDRLAEGVHGPGASPAQAGVHAP